MHALTSLFNLNLQISYKILILLIDPDTIPSVGRPEKYVYFAMKWSLQPTAAQSRPGT